MDTSPDTMENNLARLEAVLFVHGEPLAFQKIAGVMGIGESDIEPLLAEYAKRLATNERGLMVIIADRRAQLATKPEFSTIVEAFVKSELSEELSPASLETLAIVAYFGPISRSRIDYQRGVNSTFILRSLLLRGLIERRSDPIHPNSYVYSPTFDMLKYIGVDKPSALPQYEKFHSLLTRFEAVEGSSAPVPPHAEVPGGGKPYPSLP